ncbi:DUF1269 domain-containing protein [Cryobacterium sp. N22]|uniref:DUF1269 domain-containing protein n=1 Tax=Cryobacterium sp. N22 TaxID=2048290 RepID=UPI000CE3B3A7|nr:DUF1269 domain-containing protein [Cryobacterium sp. N22]
MAQSDGVFLFIGTYPSEEAARADYDVVKELRSAGAVGAYDAAVITKDDKGKIHVNKDETATRKGGWVGAGIGAAVGLIFAPAVIATAIVGAGVGAVGGHLAKGLSRSDLKELGDLIDEGEAALLVVGESTVEDAIDKTELKAEKRVAKQLDVSTEDVDEAFKDAAGEVS